jgi:hypothetical protein
MALLSLRFSSYVVGVGENRGLHALRDQGPNAATPLHRNGRPLATGMPAGRGKSWRLEDPLGKEVTFRVKGQMKMALFEHERFACTKKTTIARFNQ